MHFSIKRGSRLSLKSGLNEASIHRFPDSWHSPNSSQLRQPYSVYSSECIKRSLQSAFHHFPHFAAFNLLFTAGRLRSLSNPLIHLSGSESATSDGWNGRASCALSDRGTPRALSKMIRALRSFWSLPFRTMLPIQYDLFRYGPSFTCSHTLSISFITLYVYTTLVLSCRNQRNYSRSISQCLCVIISCVFSQLGTIISIYDTTNKVPILSNTYELILVWILTTFCHANQNKGVCRLIKERKPTGK